MNVRIDESWRQVLQPEFDKPYFELLTDFVRHAYGTRQCFPPAKYIFRAFDLSLPLDVERIFPKNCGIFLFEFKDGKWSLLAWNYGVQI